MYISMRGQKILKIIHLLTVSYWIGGCLAVLTLLYASFGAQNDDALFGILLSSRFVGIVVTAYMGAYASFFTGLAYSICTNRGFVRHKWIIIKWIITVSLIVSGASCSAPWGAKLLELAGSHGLAALELDEFQFLRSKLLLMLAVQAALLVVATIISVYRPWEDEENASRYRRSTPKARKSAVLPAYSPDRSPERLPEYSHSRSPVRSPEHSRDSSPVRSAEHSADSLPNQLPGQLPDQLSDRVSGRVSGLVPGQLSGRRPDRRGRKVFRKRRAKQE